MRRSYGMTNPPWGGRPWGDPRPRLRPASGAASAIRLKVRGYAELPAHSARLVQILPCAESYVGADDRCLGGDMQPHAVAAEARPVLPPCQYCRAPMRIRTIEVLDRREEIRFACAACGTETIQSYRLGN